MVKGGSIRERERDRETDKERKGDYERGSRGMEK